MKSMIAILAVLASASALADTADVTFTPPTTREDGTPLPAAEIAGYRLSWTLNGTAQTDKTVPPGNSYVLDTGASTGRICAILRTVDTDGLESAPTAEVCRKARPKAPTSLRAR